MKDFTFKTEKPKGQWRSFYLPSHYIKHLGKIVGSIDDDFPHRIRLKVIKANINEDRNPNCIWRWITLKKENANIQEAKDFLNANKEAIASKYNLYYAD